MNSFKILTYNEFIIKTKELLFNNIDHSNNLNPICENMDITKEVKKALRRVF